MRLTALAYPPVPLSVARPTTTLTDLALLPDTQCDAVRTQLDRISVPPQKCEPQRLRSDVMNWYLPSGTAVPPTIRSCADAAGAAGPIATPMAPTADSSTQARA